MSSLSALFETTRQEGRTAFLPFMTAGLPTPATSLDMFLALQGADGFEVGIPYSDPLMDGPTIQEAGQRALRAGTTLDIALDLVSRLVDHTGKPALVMTYTNVVLRVGPMHFARRAADAGAAGLIVADLPFEESAEIHEAAVDAGLGMVLFAAPTSGPDRIARIAAAEPAFIYGVAELGVTGERTASGSRAKGLSEQVRSVTDLPLVMGVGISTPDQAGAMAPLADGVIVGSALVRRVIDAPTPADAVPALGSLSSAIAAALR